MTPADVEETGRMLERLLAALSEGTLEAPSHLARRLEGALSAVRAIDDTTRDVPYSTP